jgi:hypothetical protein
MLVAKVVNNQVIEVADYRAMFPNTSFSAQGIHPSFFEENGIMEVNVFKPYDHATEFLEPCEPYIEDGKVYTVKVAQKPVVDAPVIDDTVVIFPETSGSGMTLDLNSVTL